MKRLNPQTGKPFKSGEMREDGKIFYQYSKRILKNGFFYEKWSSKETYDKKAKWRNNIMSTKFGHIKLILRSIKHRAKTKNLDFDLDAEYVFSIAPDICPVLNTPLSWSIRSGKNTINSPSIGRIDSSKGYLKGNIQVISNRANTIKNDATLEELKSLVLHMEKICG